MPYHDVAPIVPKISQTPALKRHDVLSDFDRKSRKSVMNMSEISAARSVIAVSQCQGPLSARGITASTAARSKQPSEKQMSLRHSFQAKTPSNAGNLLTL